MGYRLTIKNENKEIIFYDDRKLYGYYDDIEKSNSAKFLFDIVGHEKFYDDIYLFVDTCILYEELCQVSIDNLLEFLRLYNEDLKTHGIDHRIDEKVCAQSRVKYVTIGWG